MQRARKLPEVFRKARSVYAMSGGTLLALAANEIVLGEFSVLGPIDPQIVGLPAASIVKARDSKPVVSVFDLTLVLADVAETASFWSSRTERRATARQTWMYRAAIFIGAVLMTPWTAQLIGE